MRAYVCVREFVYVLVLCFGRHSTRVRMYVRGTACVDIFVDV